MTKKPGAGRKKLEARSQKPEGKAGGSRSLRRFLPLLLAPGFLLLAPSHSLAQPTQEEVFKSIGQSVDQPVDSSKVLAVLAAIGGGLVLLVVVGQRRGRETRPRSLNQPRKLMKEVLRIVPLKGAELKQVKLLAQDLRPGGRDERVQSPLTLLLCPSLLAEAAKQCRGKADLPVVAGLVKKLVSKG
jgi:hypothetical protein